MKIKRAWATAIILLSTLVCFSPLLSAQTKTNKKIKPLKPLAHGLLWNQGVNREKMQAPQVEKVPVPSLQTKGIRTYGAAYKFQVPDKKSRFPLHIAFPIPAGALDQPENMVFVKISQGKEEILFPSRIDREKGYATVLCYSFSTYIPASWEELYPTVQVKGDLTLASGCEEEPDLVYFDISCPATEGGHKANFVVQVDGITSFQLFMPLPMDYFGIYTCHRLIGSSDNFIYTMKPESKRVDIDGLSKTCHVHLHVIPSTTQFKGKVVDEKDKPLAGVKISLESNDGMFYDTRSRADGSYYIQMVGLSDPQNQPTESYAYELVNPEEDDLNCEKTIGTISGTAGRTTIQDLVVRHQGYVLGKVTDHNLVPIAGAKITVRAENNETYTAVTDSGGDYEIPRVRAGEAQVTAVCPDGKGAKTKSHEVKCADIPDYVKPLDFVLDCSDGYTFSIFQSGAMESEGKYLAHKVSTSVEFPLFLPKGREEASTEVVYSVAHHLTAKKGGKLHFVPDKTEFNLEAVVRWTVRKTVNRHGVVEFGFRREVIDAKSQKFNVRMYENGEYIDTMDTAYENLIELALVSPKVVYVKELDMPFKKDYQRESTLPVNAGAIPGGDSIRSGKTQHRTSLVIECDSCKRKEAAD